MRKVKNKITAGVLLFMSLFFLNNLDSQDNQLVTISGMVSCIDTSIGILENVNVYNKQQEWGSITNGQGEFEIKMGRNDTLFFSTIQHKEEIFTFPKVEEFIDKNIHVTMILDTIILDVITVMGVKSFEAFKQELLRLKFKDDDISLALPIVDKYAKQHASGEGAFEISGPLTYIINKIQRIRKRSSY
jgi:cell fate (sporulation/competence/biofilm development) regulator YmcA (YheA/YmcA/DUF963 family)